MNPVVELVGDPIYTKTIFQVEVDVNMDAKWRWSAKLTEAGEVRGKDWYLYGCAFNMDPMICGSDQKSVARGRVNDRKRLGSC